MLFTSIEFILFLAVVFCVWIAASGIWRVRFLLAASYSFYAWWEPWFLLVLVYCTVISWKAGQWLSGASKGRRKQILAGAVVLNLLPLLFFKYYNFFNDSVGRVVAVGGWHYPVPYLELLLPVGISFYTFQAVSYCADVYQRKIEPEPDSGVFALYLSFFPKLISGPIERGRALLPQLKGGGVFDRDLFVSGCRLFMWGVFKKIVLADRMGMYVNMVFADPGSMYGVTAIAGAVMFSLQIYCDFSAYMDMAIGVGRMFGIELSRNFNFPYMARSIGDFWRRWHITLTSWFRDYVYIPLGGNRVKPGVLAVNISLVFLLSGLWHGAAYTFVVWGALHAMFYLVGKVTSPARKRLRHFLGIRGSLETALQVLVTFNLVSLAWVFFRAGTLTDAISLIQNMVLHLDLPVRMMASQFSTALAFAAAAVFVGIELVSFWAANKNIDLVQTVPAAIRYPGYAGVLVAISLLGVSSNQFIYFQF